MSCVVCVCCVVLMCCVLLSCVLYAQLHVGSVLNPCGTSLPSERSMQPSSLTKCQSIKATRALFLCVCFAFVKAPFLTQSIYCCVFASANHSKAMWLCFCIFLWSGEASVSCLRHFLPISPSCDQTEFPGPLQAFQLTCQAIVYFHTCSHSSFILVPAVFCPCQHTVCC